VAERLINIVFQLAFIIYIVTEVDKIVTRKGGFEL